MNFKPETLKTISRNRKLLESKLKVKITINKEEPETQGEEVACYVAEKVFHAMDNGFSAEKALLLINEDFVFEQIPIRSITKKKNLNSVRGRIIGTKGKTLRLISELSGCDVELDDKIVGIIGPAEKIKDAVNAIKSIIQGSKQSNVYSYLERQRRKKVPESLGLKEKKVK